MDNQQLLDIIKSQQKQIDALNEEIYRDNFTANQTFTKYSNFKTRLKVPHYDTLPTTCEVGEILERSGKLYVCSASNTWTIVGTQS